jgi:hypothetical protein
MTVAFRFGDVSEQEIFTSSSTCQADEGAKVGRRSKSGRNLDRRRR